MATITNNILIDGMSGKFGDALVFRTMRGKTFVSAPARKPNIREESAAQRNTRVTFREAAHWAQAILLNPEKKAYYLQRARKLKLPNAYTAAITDYMRKPKVVKLQNRDTITYSVSKRGFTLKEVKVEFGETHGKQPMVVTRQYNSEWFISYTIDDGIVLPLTLVIIDNALCKHRIEDVPIS
jgi:hypothetical protein